MIQQETPVAHTLSISVQRLWNRSGKWTLRLASKGDAKFRYATGSIQEARRRGLLPENYRPGYGEVLMVEVDQRLCLLRCNRKNGNTLAGNLPEGLLMPQAVEGCLMSHEYDVRFIGSFTGASIATLEPEREYLPDDGSEAVIPEDSSTGTGEQ